MKILKIISDTIVDGPHLRTSIYVSGCRHYCKNCHNPESWNFDAGVDWEIDELAEKILSFDNNYLTISGGDPMYSAKDCYELCKLLKQKNPKMNIWAYTGFTLEELEKSDNKDITNFLSVLDGLVDGPFIESLKTKELRFRGSSNQRIFVKENENWKLW